MAPHDRYVTSKGIEKVMNRVGTDIVPPIAASGAQVDETGVPGWGFGILGNQTIGPIYDDAQGHARNLFTEAEEVAQSWIAALAICRANWRAAEDHSVVRYQ